MRGSLASINSFLQEELRRLGLEQVTAVQANQWLARAGLLDDSATRPGSPLRRLLRAGSIIGAAQRPPAGTGRWFIVSVEGLRIDAERVPGTDSAREASANAIAIASAAGGQVDLTTEAQRAITAVDACAAATLVSGVPTGGGLYSLRAKSTDAVDQLGLSDALNEEPLVERILYLGKAEDSLRSRLADTHFATGKTGQSTVRRTLAALLGLSPTLRRSRVREPTRKQLMTMSANYSIVGPDDRRLTDWMQQNLEVRGVETTWQPLGGLERAVGAVLKPPLDQETPPMWTPNPWRAQVSEARKRMRSIVRRDVGLE